MSQFRAMLHRLRGLFRRGTREAEMNAELQAHLDGLTERNIAAGMPPEKARRAATLAFGGAAQLAERARDERRSLWLEQLGQDVRYAARALAKAPSFTITAVLTLAFGIGVNAALFSVFNMVALRPLPVKDPDSLIRIAGRNVRGGDVSRFNYAEYVTYRDGNRTMEDVLAFGEATVPFQRDGGADHDPRLVPVEGVSENYFRMLGGRLQLGRAFRPEEVKPGASPVIVLSHLFWTRHFHADPNVLGATFTLNRRLVTVIGVTIAEFSGQSPIPPAGWLPFTEPSGEPAFYGPDGPQNYHIIGRLKPGIAEAQAKADLDTMMALRATEYPGGGAKVSAWLERGLTFINIDRFTRNPAPFGMIFFGFALVLLIACTNVANLLLARGVSRQPEIGVRLTLGAGRGRIVRQLLTENLLLCGLGAAIGLGLASWTLRALYPVIVARLPVDWAIETRGSVFFDTTPDLRVLGFTALLTIGATLVAGLLPAWHAASASLIATIRNDGSAFGRRLSPSRLRQLLVIAQVAICLMLLSCAGMLARNFFALRSVEPGFEAHTVFSMSMSPNPANADRNAAFRQALDTVRTIPGVAAIGVANRAPLFGAAVRPRIRVGETRDDATEEQIAGSFVTGEFFDTFRIPLVRGRAFRGSEQQVISRAIIVSESLARRLWPGQEAVGRTLAVSESTWASRERPAPADAYRLCEVIGVAGDIVMSMEDVMARKGKADRRLIYLPFALEAAAGGPVYIRPHSDSPAALAEIVRAAEAGGVSLQFGRRHSFMLNQLVTPFYAMATLSGALGALALGMASVGLYGVTTFAVSQRVREIGIRMALGATAEKVVRLFLRQSMRLVAIGLALGLVGGGLLALLVGKVLNGFVDAFDPVAFATVTALFALIALFACWLPARRATRVDPNVALRVE